MGLDENMKLRSKIESLGEEIVGEIYHGECFYELDMLYTFFDKLSDLRTLSAKYYQSNLEEE